MKQITKYMPVILLGLVIAGPALAAIVLPTPPQTGTSATVTGASLVALITQIFNYLVIISTIIAIAVIIYAGVKYALMGDANARPILIRGIIGLAIILGVGLIVNTVAGIISRGLNIG